jgi:hypothetical protein
MVRIAPRQPTTPFVFRWPSDIALDDAVSAWHDRRGHMKHRIIWVSAAGAVLLPLLALAQTGASASPGTSEGLRRLDTARGAGAPPEGVQLSAEAAVGTLGLTMVDGGGSVETWRGRVRGGLMYRLEDVSLSVIGEEEWVSYDRDNGALAGWPENVRMDRLSLNGDWRPGGDWSFFGSLTFSAGVGAGDGKWSEGVAGGGMLFGRRQVTPRFAWLLGLIVYDRLGDSVLVMPVPGIDWRVTPRLSLVTGHGVVLNYRLDAQGQWRVNGAALFEATVCAVEEGGGEAILRDERVPVTVGLEFRSKEGLRLQAFGGVVAWRRWELDHGNDEDSTWRGDPGLVFGLEGGTRF